MQDLRSALSVSVRRVIVGHILTLAFALSSCVTMQQLKAPDSFPPAMELDPALFLRQAPRHESVADLPKVDVTECGSLGSFAPSFYQIVDERMFPREGASEDVLDRHGNRIARATGAFFRRLNIEGCGRLADGRVVTYDTRINGKIRFQVTDASYGLSHRDRPLVPYRTVAVDPRSIPLGSVLFVPATRGTRLPDGSIHDGLFFADDVGSAIVGNRVDLFVGLEDHVRNSFTAEGRLTHLSPIIIYEVPDETAVRLAARAVRHALSATGASTDGGALADR